MRRTLGVLLIAGVCAATVAVPGRAQRTRDPGPAPCSVTPQPDPCGTTPAPADKSGAKEKFPFPGIGGASTSDSGAPSISGVPQAPDAPGAAGTAAPKSFPFPGDADKSDATGSTGGSSSSSSSSSEDAVPIDPDAASAAAPGLKDEGSTGKSATPGRHILHRVNPVGTKLQTIDEREQEDLDVAHFYVDSGDLPGAYLRSKDAVKIAPDDPDAHFALAEIALKLNKKDEAIAEYNAVLKLDPTPKQARDSRKALAKLKP